MYSQVKMQRIRLFLIFEGAVFFTAAIFHSGLLSSAYQNLPSAIVEVLLTAAMAGAFGISLTRPRQTRLASISVHVGALLLTLVGIIIIAMGIGPRTAPDVIYHMIMLLVLARGLALSRKPLLEMM